MLYFVLFNNYGLSFSAGDSVVVINSDRVLWQVTVFFNAFNAFSVLFYLFLYTRIYASDTNECTLLG